MITRSSLSSLERTSALRSVWIAAAGAALVACLMVVVLGICLHSVGGALNEETLEIIEGVSKVVASFFILKLSLKVPKWLNVYLSVDKSDGTGLSSRELFLNVSWNIWREVAEAAVFLVPFFLSANSLYSVPLSVFVGVVVGISAGALIYYVNSRVSDLRKLAIFMAALTGFLAVGLFTYGLHEFEEVAGETPCVYVIPVDKAP